MTFTIGQRVNRIEDRAITGATVITIQDETGGGVFYEIAYDEGGSGWWPEDSLTPGPPLAANVGQEWIASDGALWRVVQARGDDGQFVPDDPATAERESLRWIAMD